MDDRAMYVKQDIANYPFTRTFYDGVDVVFHLAAESRVQPAIENPIQAFERMFLVLLLSFNVLESMVLRE